MLGPSKKENEKGLDIRYFNPKKPENQTKIGLGNDHDFSYY
jgi:hypothetical protein